MAAEQGGEGLVMECRGRGSGECECECCMDVIARVRVVSARGGEAECV